MTRQNLLLAATAGLTFTLAACGDDEAEIAAEPDVDAVVVEYDPMTRDYQLSEEAQTRRAEFDEEAFRDEYRGYREDIVGEQVNLTGSEDRTDEETTAAAKPRDANTNMRDRSNMTWSYLDRNGDGQLSVAEYAIWAIPLDPTAPKRNDQTQPYLTSDQANKAADSFFYYDQGGDTYLSQQEFSAARRGDNLS
jgi:hypothetical protein